jgi:hypothetical protein
MLVESVIAFRIVWCLISNIRDVRALVWGAEHSARLLIAAGVKSIYRKGGYIDRLYLSSLMHKLLTVPVRDRGLNLKRLCFLRYVHVDIVCLLTGHVCIAERLMLWSWCHGNMIQII